MAAPDMNHPPTGPIPVPPDFPINWDTPEDAHLFWQHERMHFPDPITPLEAELMSLTESALQDGANFYEMPLTAKWYRVNTYLYQTVIPKMGSPEEMAAQGKRAEEKLGAAMGQMDQMWEQQQLPEIKSMLAFWETFDLAKADLSALLAHLEETLSRFQRAWQIHFRVVFPMFLPISLYEEMYLDLFSDAGQFEPYALLQGFETKTTEGGRELWKLSRKALATPQVRQILEEQATADVLAQLQQSAAGRAFLNDLAAFLQEYGQRSDKWALSTPSWIEDPSPAIKNLKDYISQPDRDLTAEMDALAATREQHVAKAREQLQGYPQPVVEQFEFLLKAAQYGTYLSEEHAFWIDFRVGYRTRQVFVELGRRLAQASVINSANDVFYLTTDELKTSAGNIARGTVTPLKNIVAERQAHEAHFAAKPPPPIIGTFPPGPPPDDPASRAIIKFVGGPPQQAAAPNELKGNAGSPGTVRGPAKIIRSLSEAGKLQPGDILVAETTAPPWTPLFATAAAVVTDTGGILSHCAVVAREYQIPAVVGIGMATAVLHDGQLIEVDGTAGIVRIVQ